MTAPLLFYHMEHLSNASEKRALTKHTPSGIFIVVMTLINGKYVGVYENRATP